MRLLAAVILLVSLSLHLSASGIKGSVVQNPNGWLDIHIKGNVPGMTHMLVEMECEHTFQSSVLNVESDSHSNRGRLRAYSHGLSEDIDLTTFTITVGDRKGNVLSQDKFKALISR